MWPLARGDGCRVSDLREVVLDTAVFFTSLALALVGCSPSRTDLSTTSVESRIDLPTASAESCAGRAVPAVLRGDAADATVAWIEGYWSHERIDVVWPTGFTGRFDPDLEILDPSGRVVLREGDYIDGTCGVVSQGRELLLPPFFALRLDCGPLSIFECQLAVSATARANGWPDREIAEIQFLDSEARYRLVYEDGTTAGGQAPMP